MAWLLNFKGQMSCEREKMLCLHSGSNPAAANEIAAVLAQDSVH